MTTISGVSSVSQATGGLGVEGFMQMMYATKANNLEAQQVDQINEIKAKQDDIAKLNQLLADLRALRPKGDDSGKFAVLGSSQAEAREMVKRLQDAGVSIDAATADGGAVKTDDSKVGQTNEWGAKDANGKGTYDATQVSFDKWIEQIKGKLDAKNNESQLDMIRMQSINNKHNQSVEALSNLVQKTAKMNDTIIGNMR
ncbi:MAG TPA: hypothetical protein VK196_16285 [Magnetospirillum sp.]|nr:hypothetical protein [Magnetospirillum sp.]